MSGKIEIKLIIKPFLMEYFEAGMCKENIDFSTAEELTRFLALVLNDTMYLLSSSITGKNEISLSYRPKAYADPIF